MSEHKENNNGFNIKRDDPLLIKVIEQLGKKAALWSGCYIKVVTIPDEYAECYELKDYDKSIDYDRSIWIECDPSRLVGHKLKLASEMLLWYESPTDSYSKLARLNTMSDEQQLMFLKELKSLIFCGIQRYK